MYIDDIFIIPNPYHCKAIFIYTASNSHKVQRQPVLIRCFLHPLPLNTLHFFSLLPIIMSLSRMKHTVQRSRFFKRPFENFRLSYPI